MKEYIVARIGYMILTLFLIATLLFFLFRLLPGDPTITVLSPAMDEAAVKHLRHVFGLDLPLWRQYLIFLKNLVTLDFGRSFSSGQEVAGIIGYRLINTLLLMSAGMALAVLLGVGLGTVMAWRRGGVLDVAGTLAEPSSNRLRPSSPVSYCSSCLAIVSSCFLPEACSLPARDRRMFFICWSILIFTIG